MDVIGRLKTKYYRLAGSRNFKTFMKFGAPMFVFCVGGSYLLEEFQIVRSVLAPLSYLHLVHFFHHKYVSSTDTSTYRISTIKR